MCAQKQKTDRYEGNSTFVRDVSEIILIFLRKGFTHGAWTELNFARDAVLMRLGGRLTKDRFAKLTFCNGLNFLFYTVESLKDDMSVALWNLYSVNIF